MSRKITPPEILHCVRLAIKEKKRLENDMIKLPTGAPERIYLQHDPENEGGPFSEAHDVTWCADKINDTDIEYVRADLLKRRKAEALLRQAREMIAYPHTPTEPIKLIARIDEFLKD